MQDVGYYLVKTRRERRSTSHGPSIRIAEASTTAPAPSTARASTGTRPYTPITDPLGFITKHLYFSVPEKKFRVRYDRVMDLEPFVDGFGIMRDA